MIFTFLLFKKGIEKDSKDSKWLAWFIFLGGLYLCPFMLGYAGWYSIESYREFMFFIPFQQLFLIGPVFFFYILSLLNRNFELSRKDLVHFVLPIIYLIYSLVVFVGDKIILEQFYFYADGRDKDLDFWYQMAGLISMLYYLTISLKYYWDYRKLSLQEVSYADEIAFKWIKIFAAAFGFILILRVLFFIINPEWGEFGSKYWYYLCFGTLLMYISISGYSNTVKVGRRFRTDTISKLESIKTADPRKSNEPSTDFLVLEEWKDKIIDLFDNDSIYRNPNLTLTDVASLLNTNRNIISGVINQEFDMNFNDFVNIKRAEAVIKKLRIGEHANRTLLSIALDCGFNSKTTFNRAFKKHTALTPKHYISRHKL